MFLKIYFKSFADDSKLSRLSSWILDSNEHFCSKHVVNDERKQIKTSSNTKTYPPTPGNHRGDRPLGSLLDGAIGGTSAHPCQMRELIPKTVLENRDKNVKGSDPIQCVTTSKYTFLKKKKTAP